MKKLIESEVLNVLHTESIGMYCSHDKFNVEYKDSTIIVHAEKDNEINSEMSVLQNKISKAFCNYFKVLFKFDIYYTWNQ